ncbi:MAG: SBBP repeat-containing protein [Spirochaetota bacterium]
MKKLDIRETTKPRKNVLIGALFLICIVHAFGETAPDVLNAWQFGTAEFDGATALTVDTGGNIIVAGFTKGSLSGASAGISDAFVRKYDPKGNELWTRQFGTAESDGATALAVDPGGNIIVAGYTGGNLFGSSAGKNDAFVRKYDPKGTELWRRQFGSAESDLAAALAVDAEGNILVAGSTEGRLSGSYAGNEDIFVRKYNSKGNELWTRQFGSAEYDFAKALAVDAGGNILVAGITWGNLAGSSAGDYDAFVLKYDSKGTMLWTRQFGTAKYDDATALAVDAGGNIIVAGPTMGNLSGSSAGNSDLFVRKYDPKGTVLWTRRFGTIEFDDAKALAVDTGGNIIVAGDTGGNISDSSITNYDAFVRKYDFKGSVLWMRQFGTAEDDYTTAIAVDAGSNIMVAGYTSGSLFGDSAGDADAFVMIYKP